MKKVQSILDAFLQLHSDRRTELAEIKILSIDENCIFLGGKILDNDCLNDLLMQINEEAAGCRVDTHRVKVLHKVPADQRTVAVNLTSVHTKPSWLAEMLSQVDFGARLEVLEEREKWVFVRQEDGYLGWVFAPYLVDRVFPEPTHMVTAPFTLVYEKPESGSALTTRLAAGTKLRIGEQENGWCSIPSLQKGHLSPMTGGWMEASSLIALDAIPADAESKRQIITNTAFLFYGVPYLWGGCSAGGIDCSGLARLAYRLAGIEIPRDAGMQKQAGKPVERPFKVGDLIFFTGENDPTRSEITHVAISLGGEKVIHSSRMNNGVYINEMQEIPHLRDDFAGAVTYLWD